MPSKEGEGKLDVDLNGANEAGNAGGERRCLWYPRVYLPAAISESKNGSLAWVEENRVESVDEDSERRICLASCSEKPARLLSWKGKGGIEKLDGGLVAKQSLRLYLFIACHIYSKTKLR